MVLSPFEEWETNHLSVYSWTFWRPSSFLNDKMHQIHKLWQQCLRVPMAVAKWNIWWNLLVKCKAAFLSLRLLRDSSEVLQFSYWVANSQSAKSYPGVTRLFMCGLKHPCEATSLSYALILEVLIFPKFTSWVNICFKPLCWSLGTAEGGAPLDLHYWLKHSPSLYFSEV